MDSNEEEDIAGPDSETRPIGTTRVKYQASLDKQREDAAPIHVQATARLALSMQERNQLIAQAADFDILITETRGLTPTAVKLLERIPLKLEQKWTTEGTLDTKDA